MSFCTIFLTFCTLEMQKYVKLNFLKLKKNVWQTLLVRGSVILTLIHTLLRTTFCLMRRMCSLNISDITSQTDLKLKYAYQKKVLKFCSKLFDFQYFSRNRKPTILTKDPERQDDIGNRYGHSFRNIKLANLMYGCNGEWAAPRTLLHVFLHVFLLNFLNSSTVKQ